MWLLDLSGESLAKYPRLRDPSRLALFNWTIGYDARVFREASHIFFPSTRLDDYLTTDSLDGTSHMPFVPLLRPGQVAMLDQWNARPGGILFLASNCRDVVNRLAFAKALMAHLPIDSLGACLPSDRIERDPATHRPRALRASALEATGDDVIIPWADPPAAQGGGEDHRRGEAAWLLGRYRFVLALENSHEDDYVTEKLWDALRAGALPIYLGAPNVLDHLPDKEAIVDVRAFGDVAALAAYVRRVANDRALQARHLDWHVTGNVSEAFRGALRAAARDDGATRACVACKRLHLFRSRASRDVHAAIEWARHQFS